MTSHSILNDILGPIMTGPSSSHTAAPGKIGLSVAQLWGKKIKNATVIYDAGGSYPNTHIGQGSDMGFTGGLLGLQTDNPHFRNAIKVAKLSDIHIDFEISEIGSHHPNEARIDVFENSDMQVAMSVLSFSTGGGTFLLTELDGFNIDFDGQRKKHYLACEQGVCEQTIREKLVSLNAKFEIRYSEKGRTTYISVPSPTAVLFEVESASLKDGMFTPETLQTKGVHYHRTAEATVPIPLPLEQNSSFSIAEDALLFAEEKNITTLAQLALEYECSLGSINENYAYEKMKNVLDAMRSSMHAPPEDDSAKNILLPQYAKHLSGIKKLPLDLGVANRCIEFAVAVMENNCAHRIVVAAPTAGSAGVIPAAVISVGDAIGCSDEEIIDGLWAAGLVGAFIANQATFGAEVAGCQAEIGSAACMAAAGAVQLMGGTILQGFHAASIAMQSFLGLICDPIGGLTEFPCIQRNVTASVVSVMAANMALCGMKSLIPLDETLQTMLKVGQSLPSELRCTCLGGLCDTKTGRELSEQVKRSFF